MRRFGFFSLGPAPRQPVRVRRRRNPAKPGETVERHYKIIGKGETEGAEKLFLIPRGANDLGLTLLKESLDRTAQDLKRRGGIRPFTILSQEVAGDHAEVKVEYTLGDGAAAKDKIDAAYDGEQWKLLARTSASALVANEIAAIMAVREITHAQILYSVTRGRGRFTNLATLGREGLIDSQLASGGKQGYLFTSNAIIVKNRAMFDTTAKPKQPGTPGMGSRSYYCNETAVIYEAEGGDPPKATVSNRVPKNGAAIDR